MPAHRAHRAALLAALLLLPGRRAAAEVREDFPCPGCVTVLPEAGAVTPSGPAGPAPDGGASGSPAPLLVALHGDEGTVRPIVRAWQAAASSAGVVLLAPRCPRALGCKASFWQWLETSGHDPAWLGAQIDAVAARVPIDPRRVYATGYSGGATYLGWYAPQHAARFAAVAHVAGGAAYRPPCPACKVPVLFVLGATDPMIVPYTRPLRDYYETCGGHEIAWETLPGVTHESILQTLQTGKAKQILGWLLAKPAACVEAPVAPRAEAPGAVTMGTAPPSPVEAPRVDEPPRAATEPSPPAPPKVPPAAGCACALPPGKVGRGAASMAAMLAAAAIAGRRRRTRRPDPRAVHGSRSPRRT